MVTKDKSVSAYRWGDMMYDETKAVAYRWGDMMYDETKAILEMTTVAYQRHFLPTTRFATQLT